MKGKDLTERVYKTMKKDLLMGKIPSNELFSEQMLADRYQCSRTPAREAAGLLVSEGYLNKYPSKGYIVNLPTDQKMSEMRYCCYVLENAALELSVHVAYREEIKRLLRLIEKETKDPEEAYFSNMVFHCELAKLSRNQTIVDLVEELQSKLVRAESAPSNFGPEFIKDSYSMGVYTEIVQDKSLDKTNHKAIVEALQNRDLETAKRILLKDFYKDMKISDESQKTKPTFPFDAGTK